MTYLGVFARAALIVVFAVSSGGKLSGRAAFADFAGSMADLGFLRWAGPLAAVLAGCEVAVVVLLAVPYLATVGLVLAVALLVVLLLGVGVVVRRGQRVRCRCFGPDGQPLGVSHLVRNGFLLAIAGAGLATRLLTSGAGLGGAAVAAATGAVVGGIVTQWDSVVYVATTG